MWRDTLRRQLRFPLLQIDFRTIQADNENALCVYSLAQPEQAAPWPDVLNYLKKLTAVCLKYTVEVLSGTSDNYAYEYNGPSLAIMENVNVSKDNDVDMVVDGITMPQLTSLLTTYKTLSTAISKFETAANMPKKTAVGPKHFFRLPDKAQRMKDFHNR